jgi:hypothetical protein
MGALHACPRCSATRAAIHSDTSLSTHALQRSPSLILLGAVPLALRLYHSLRLSPVTRRTSGKRNKRTQFDCPGCAGLVFVVMYCPC